MFWVAVEALRVPRLRIAHSDRLRRNCHGGGAFGSQMNIFSRFARVIKVRKYKKRLFFEKKKNIYIYIYVNFSYWVLCDYFFG